MMEPRKSSPLSWVFLTFFLTISLCGVNALSEDHHAKPHVGPVVEKNQRRTLLVTEFGEVTAIDIKEGQKELPYHLQFITLDPNSLFLPVLLHADMVFYVQTGSGKLTQAHDDGTTTIPLREGDVCSLSEGSVFYIQSNLEAERRKLRIYAIFTNTDDNTFDPSIGAYSRINELVKGFDKAIMQAALKVPDDLIKVITNKRNTPAIVHAVSEKRNIVQGLEAIILESFSGVVASNSKKVKTYNIFSHDPDFRNRYGWSIEVTKKQLKSLKRTNIGFFMVNLTRGSILGPHWNPKATELTMGSEGRGMVRVVCGSGNEEETECQNMRFKVKEGDAFVVSRFQPMAQMSFNDGPFVFVGFSTSAKRNHPQFLAGKGSLLDILDKQILATSFGVSNRTIKRLLRSPADSIIFGCSSCAEEEEKIVKEEDERKRREEEERKREEEEEEARKRERERKREEEEARREREREEEKEREEEEARRQQEDRERKRAEEEARRERERQREEEAEAAAAAAAAKREQEKRERRRQEEAEREQEQARKEAEEAAKREQEQARREAEAAAKKEQEQARREAAAAAAKREQEQARKKAEGAAKREQERAKREQEKRRQEEEQREEEEEEEEEGGWTRREKGKTPEGVEWEQEEAMRPQIHRSSFHGRRVLKTRKL
ncbi:hypothetical protein VNO78_08285 [Psophocarpus tetragonolobus]|uniref:Cupin type-1 domain-containing protein n=1 Tax=Psophocarpus tetragonolobus TaxID=3891 RepID=A0AAN9XTK7_PSOTE